MASPRAKSVDPQGRQVVDVTEETSSSRQFDDDLIAQSDVMQHRDDGGFRKPIGDARQYLQRVGLQDQQGTGARSASTLASASTTRSPLAIGSRPSAAHATSMTETAGSSTS